MSRRAKLTGVEREGTAPPRPSPISWSPAAASAAARAQAEPRPHDLAGEAEIVEPLRPIAGHAGGQHRLLPRARGQLEALELLDRRQEAAPPLALGARRDVLPAEEEADVVLRRHGLDLLAQALRGVAMDARQEAALAELDRAVAGPVGIEVPAEHEALGLEREQRLLRRGGR